MLKSVLIATLIIFQFGCSGSQEGGAEGGASAMPESSLSILDFVDPNRGVDQIFGVQALELENGNIVIRSLDSSTEFGAGAVHIYTREGVLLESYFGNAAFSLLGSNGVVPLSNGNFVIASGSEDIGGISNSGAIQLIDGITGDQIGSTLAGDNASDSFGAGDVIDIGNGNFAFSSPSDDVGGLTNAGSVMVIDGATGTQVGATIVGDAAGDSFGSDLYGFGVGKLAISSTSDSPGGVNRAGSLMLIDGSDLTQIGATYNGSAAFDRFGVGGVVDLPNGNIVVSASTIDFSGVTDVGEVRLINGTSGATISVIRGDNTSDRLSSGGITVLENGNFIIGSGNDDVGGVTNAGSVMLIDGSTGAQIGSTLAGNFENDFFGQTVLLSNGNFVSRNPNDDVDGRINAGSVSLFSGSTGAQIGSTLTGDDPGDFFGNVVTPLPNGNFVIGSDEDDIGGIINAGSVFLADGETGSIITQVSVGGQEEDRIGDKVVVLDNGNFVVVSPTDNEDGIMNAGSVALFDGETGAQIGDTIVGNNDDDLFGNSGVYAIDNLFVVASANDDSDGFIDNGSVLVFDESGVQIGDAIVGDADDDNIGSAILKLDFGGFLLISAGEDVDGLGDAGSVKLVTIEN